MTAAGTKAFRAEAAQEEPHLGANMLVDRARVCVWGAWGAEAAAAAVVVVVVVVGREAALMERVRRLLASPDREEELRMQRAIESLLAIFAFGGEKVSTRVAAARVRRFCDG